jgi:hypothetical protein
VVIHCEFFPRSDGPIIDEMVFQVAGSLRAAERYIRHAQGMPYSWWKVEHRVVDEEDYDKNGSPARHFYNHKGLLRKKEPHSSAMRAFEKWQQQEAAERSEANRK